VVRPSVHAGLEYGDIYVTPPWPPAGYGVWGRAVNLAKRLCDVAGPGELQIGPGAFARTGNRVVPTQPGQRRLKGIVNPVVSHRVLMKAG
jgi:class 3 adenylate cyclase